MAKKPIIEKKTKEHKTIIAEGKDSKTGKFVAGNRIGSSSKLARAKRAREVFAEQGFDPLNARLAYHAQLINEAQELKQNAADGVFIDLTGTRHPLFIEDTDPKNKKKTIQVVDFDRVHFVQRRIDELLGKADGVAAQLTDYVHPKLKAIEITEGGDRTWAALMEAIHDVRAAAE